jgi:hypothetical protein
MMGSPPWAIPKNNILSAAIIIIPKIVAVLFCMVLPNATWRNGQFNNYEMSKSTIVQLLMVLQRSLCLEVLGAGHEASGPDFLFPQEVK